MAIIGRYESNPAPVADGHETELLTDPIGRLEVVSSSSGPTITKEVVRTADTNAYLANDVINTAVANAVMLSFAGAARAAGGTGFITGVEIITDQSAEVWQPKLHIYSKSRTVVLQDNAAFSTTYAILTGNVWDRDITMPPLAAYGGGVAKSTLDGLMIPFSCEANDSALYFDLQTLTAIAAPVSGAKYTVRLSVIRN